MLFSIADESGIFFMEDISRTFDLKIKFGFSSSGDFSSFFRIFFYSSGGERNKFRQLKKRIIFSRFSRPSSIPFAI